ncbi:hypothetical protein CDO52_13980 [Nocardiopsis gilva YIM 90087]|uniref:Uncharacterized protein n=1 Tax=Nocardiopsis gilva YIM 90087 TaxID=1235441 RepID=A0A223S6M4_9ACTN|nr:hypothetical protein [Nocardiopsis gilva]ASU83742.1 hypothetical protein CDO52_13980 [Nocardiopsis gilva YIM 90087]
MADEAGANPNDAHKKGGDALSLADTFVNFQNDFIDAVEDAATAAAEEGIKKCYPDYGEKYSVQMSKIEDHGKKLSGNVQAGAAETAHTDFCAKDGYQPATDSLLSRRINKKTDPYDG